MLVFSMGAQPKILVAMFNEFFEEEEEEEGDEEAEEEGEQEPPNIIAQRSNLTQGELHGLDTMVPLPETYIGMPFVTRLTTTSLTRNKMVYILFQIYLYMFCANLYKKSKFSSIFQCVDITFEVG